MDTFTLVSLFVYIPVEDLHKSCRIVSRHWKQACGDDSMWLRKYILKSKVRDTKSVPGINWRKQYFNRFGRNEKVAILWDNYKNTNNDKYLKQIEQVATAACETYRTDYYSDDLIFIDKLVFWALSGGETTSRPVFARKLTYNGTIYSPNSLDFARFVVQVECLCEITFTGKQTNVNLIALFNGDSTPYHLAVEEIWSKENGPVETSACFIKNNEREQSEYFFIPFDEPCKRLATIMGKEEMSPKDFVEFLGKRLIFSTSTAELPVKMYSKTKLHKQSTRINKLDMEDCITKITVRSTEADYYERIADIARIQLHMEEVAKKAESANVSLAVKQLLSHTQIISFKAYYGKTTADQYLENFSYANICGTNYHCLFTLTLPSCEPKQFIVEINDTVNLTINRTRRIMFAEVLKNGSKFSLGRRWENKGEERQRLKPNKIEGSLLDVTEELKIDGLTIFDFKQYLLLFSSEMYSVDALTKEGDKQQLNTKFNIPALNAQLEKFKREETEITEELKWDGSQHPLYKEMLEHIENEKEEEEEEEEEDDEDDPKEDRDDWDSASEDKTDQEQEEESEEEESEEEGNEEGNEEEECEHNDEVKKRKGGIQKKTQAKKRRV